MKKLLLLILTATLIGCGGGSQSTPAVPRLTTITVSPKTATIQEGQTQTYTATAVDQYGKPFKVSSFTWVSDNADVSMNGAVAGGVAVGTADITASADGVTSGNVVLTVIAETPPPPVFTSIGVSPTSATLHVGQTQQFTAIAYDQYGTPMAPQPTAYIWATGGYVSGCNFYRTASACAGCSPVGQGQ